MSEPNSAPKGLRFAVDYGPLLVFFVTYYAAGIMWATAAIMAATAVMLGVSWYFERRLAPLPLVTAGLVAVFGGLTLLLADETFIKMKPTIVKAFIAAVLLGGLAFGKPLLKPLFGAVWKIDDGGWRKLTMAFRAVLRRHGGAERDRLAHAVHGLLGQLQAVRHDRPHIRLLAHPDTGLPASLGRGDLPRAANPFQPQAARCAVSSKSLTTRSK